MLILIHYGDAAITPTSLQFVSDRCSLSWGESVRVRAS